MSYGIGNYDTHYNSVDMNSFPNPGGFIANQQPQNFGNESSGFGDSGARKVYEYLFSI
jgi:hypothetical protein